MPAARRFGDRQSEEFQRSPQDVSVVFAAQTRTEQRNTENIRCMLMLENTPDYIL